MDDSDSGTYVNFVDDCVKLVIVRLILLPLHDRLASTRILILAIYSDTLCPIE